MKLHINPERVLFTRDIKIYGHFLEHFHRQVYGGVFDPGNPLSDGDGFREDVIEAMRKIKVPVMRWPGGCFVSAYNWKNGVGKVRTPSYDKAWRVEEPNTFGTDEYIRLCEKIGCEPYICTNAGTGTPEEMSDWVEYCNLPGEGQYAKARIANGSPQPFNVKYWSIGNENYGDWEMGAKTAEEWSRYVLESAKMMRRADSSIELSAAALADIDWNLLLLKTGGKWLDWISVHKYWDAIHQTNDCAAYEQCMAYTSELEDDIRQVRGLLTAMGLEKKIRIAFDEWNLRGWYHPDSGKDIKDGKYGYLRERDKNDDNSLYTTADAVFTACFLNALNRNADIVGMANFAPIINTRGCIFTNPGGIVLRGTYHIFDLYVNYLGDKVLDSWAQDDAGMPVKSITGDTVEVPAVDAVATTGSSGIICVAAVNKSADTPQEIEIVLDAPALQAAPPTEYRVCGVYAEDINSYNDVETNQINLSEGAWQKAAGKAIKITLPAHSANIIQIK